ncbi:MAG: RHS repeat protein [Acidobacteria bacterium]|nr:RHS repeat protein [Acidobacteriota bacterium]
MYGLENNSLVLASRTGYTYDEGDYSDTNLEQNIANVIMHDTENYGTSFTVGRGNLTTSTRYDVTGATASVSSQIKYNIAGAPVAQIDPLSRTVKISYADAFNDTSTTRNTYAYPTKLYDPAGNHSEVKYRFDTGANVWAKSPAPAGNSTGKETTREYDAVGRLLKDTVVNSGAYTRLEYPTNNIQTKVFTTIVNLGNSAIDAEDEVFSESWTDGAGRVRRSRTEHPGSTGGWSATLAEYDILGQVKRSTVPTETNSSYEPAGDDAARGWLWTQNEYDWKGRPTRTIPTDSTGSDGKDQLISYEGCGCAGGQVTTIQSEVVPKDTNPNETARRTQKVYQDILGRTNKTEMMKWDGTVYSTVITTFNGRDQAISVVKQDNTQNPVVEQISTTTYDGHGRAVASHRPEQNPGAVTSTTYNSEDSVSAVTDARGVTVSYSYNSRGLLSGYNYFVGGNTSFGASFTYDPAGNRTSMTDRLGTVNYEYDSLSRMITEHRNFTESLPNAQNGFLIRYEYGLSGNLSMITDPYGQAIDYGTDRLGRIKSISGSPWAGIQQYVNNAEYRAFGSRNSLSYSNGVSLSTDFDNRLRVSNFSASVNGSSSLSKSYQYNADSQLKFSGNPLNQQELFNRSFAYDNAGRLTKARTGTEASGIPQTDQSQLPYSINNSYNAFGNVLQSWGNNWTGPINHAASFSNNRMSDWNYDADGRLLAPNWTWSNGYSYFTYDLDGKQSQRVSGYNPPSGVGYWHKQQHQFRDGDGRLVKQTNFYQTGSVVQTNKTFYFIRSSVLEGRLLTEATTNGSKSRTLIYAGDETVAVQKALSPIGTWSPTVQWQYSDPGELSFRVTSPYGEVEVEDSAELAPDSTEVGFEDPNQNSVENQFEYGPYASFGSPTTCLMDGFETPCNSVFQMINSGSAERCPNDYCGPVTLDINSQITGEHHLLLGPFQSTIDTSGIYDQS